MSNYPLFSVFGIEIEYMLVDDQTLNIKSCSDSILHKLSHSSQNHSTIPPNEVSLGNIAVSNELVLHVLEFKNPVPHPLSAPLGRYFQDAIETMQPLLREHNVRLLPTGAHPWMCPERETKRWPHSNHAIYDKYHRIFDCNRHGWSNLQSMHLNFPFANDEEFCRLHNAIRLVLPLIPAIAASTPFLEGKRTGITDTRLHVYGNNQQTIPQIIGDIIPDFIQTEKDYHEKILSPMYQAIAPLDPEGILQHDWLNSRAAIPKFERQSIEIRIVDSQECVDADMAIASLIWSVLEHWTTQTECYLEKPIETARLKSIYERNLHKGLGTLIDDKAIYNQWQLPSKTRTSRAVWSELIEKVSTSLNHSTQKILEHILSKGNLSERLLQAYAYESQQVPRVQSNLQCQKVRPPSQSNSSTLHALYDQLSHCLLKNQLFCPS